MSRILGIETSCDETGVAVVEDGRRVLVNHVASQIAIHAPFGGVVPEIASRQHTRIIAQLVDQAMKECGPVDAVAATAGPGLMGSLLVGVNFGRAFAYARSLPFVPVHHLEGHIFSVFLGEEAPDFPFLTLLVSGGHTCLIWCPAPHHYCVVGTTRDDAIGESFDKVARLLDLPYPGGPSIQKAAVGGNPKAFDFPRGMMQKSSLDFSYSGLKTALLYQIRGAGGDPADLAASFQEAAVDALLIKTERAIGELGAERLVVAGGVAANKRLRERLSADLTIPVFVPPFAYCVDNGAMIAAAADSMIRHGVSETTGFTTSASLPLPA